MIRRRYLNYYTYLQIKQRSADGEMCVRNYHDCTSKRSQQTNYCKTNVKSNSTQCN